MGMVFGKKKEKKEEGEKRTEVVLRVRAGIKPDVKLGVGEDLTLALELVLPGLSVEAVRLILAELGEDGLVELLVVKKDGKDSGSDNA
jgi:hypothetical protein